MPKYYVNFGKEYKLTIVADSPREAAKKTLLRYLERDQSISTESNTLTVPDKFRVAERGYPHWNDVNNEDYREFSHSEISKLVDRDKGSGGELAYA